jgi:GT2 family glycosyltransferase
VYDASHIDQLVVLFGAAARCGVRALAYCNSQAALAAAELRQLPSMSSGKNMGFGPAVNLAASGSDFDWLIVANDDVVVEALAIERLITSLNQLDEAGVWIVGLVDGRGVRNNGLPGKWGVFASVSLLSAVRRRSRIADMPVTSGNSAWADQSSSGVEELGPSQYFPFVFVAISRGCWHRLGGFDPEFPLYFEDLDFLARVREVDGSHVARSAGQVLHGGSSTARKLIESTIPVLSWSAVRYLERRTKAGRRRNRLIVGSGLAVRLLLLPFGRAPVKAHLRGTLRALKMLAADRKPALADWS